MPSRASASAAGGCSRSPPSAASGWGPPGPTRGPTTAEQLIIDTEHYRRVEQGLKYVAWRNNTFSLHLHVGVHGVERAVRVCDRLRPVLPCCWPSRPTPPTWTAATAGLQSARTQSFTRSFPRCGVPEAFGELVRLQELPRAALADRFDRRIHAGVVVGAASYRLRYRRGADLRRAATPRSPTRSWR